MDISISTMDQVRRRLERVTLCSKHVKDTASFILTHADQAESISSLWLDMVKEAKDPAFQLALLYVANEVLSKSPKYGVTEFRDTLKPFVLQSLNHMNSGKMAPKLVKLINYWKHRNIFDLNCIQQLLENINNGKQKKGERDVFKAYANSDELVKNFVPEKLVDSLKTLKQLDEAIEMHKKPDISCISFSTPIETTIGSMKSKAESQALASQVESCCRSLESTVKKFDERFTFMKKLDELLETAQLYYEVQQKEVAVVVNAYKTYGKRVSNTLAKSQESAGIKELSTISPKTKSEMPLESRPFHSPDFMDDNGPTNDDDFVSDSEDPHPDSDHDQLADQIPIATVGYRPSPIFQTREIVNNIDQTKPSNDNLKSDPKSFVLPNPVSPSTSGFLKSSPFGIPLLEPLRDECGDVDYRILLNPQVQPSSKLIRPLAVDTSTIAPSNISVNRNFSNLTPTSLGSDPKINNLSRSPSLVPPMNSKSQSIHKSPVLVAKEIQDTDTEDNMEMSDGDEPDLDDSCQENLPTFKLIDSNKDQDWRILPPIKSVHVLKPSSTPTTTITTTTAKTTTTINSSTTTNTQLTVSCPINSVFDSDKHNNDANPAKHLSPQLVIPHQVSPQITIPPPPPPPPSFMAFSGHPFNPPPPPPIDLHALASEVSVLKSRFPRPLVPLMLPNDSFKKTAPDTPNLSDNPIPNSISPTISQPHSTNLASVPAFPIAPNPPLILTQLKSVSREKDVSLENDFKPESPVHCMDSVEANNQSILTTSYPPKQNNSVASTSESPTNLLQSIFSGAVPSQSKSFEDPFAIISRLTGLSNLVKNISTRSVPTKSNSIPVVGDTTPITDSSTASVLDLDLRVLQQQQSLLSNPIGRDFVQEELVKRPRLSNSIESNIESSYTETTKSSNPVIDQEIDSVKKPSANESVNEEEYFSSGGETPTQDEHGSEAVDVLCQQNPTTPAHSLSSSTTSLANLLIPNNSSTQMVANIDLNSANNTFLTNQPTPMQSIPVSASSGCESNSLKFPTSVSQLTQPTTQTKQDHLPVVPNTSIGNRIPFGHFIPPTQLLGQPPPSMSLIQTSLANNLSNAPMWPGIGSMNMSFPSLSLPLRSAPPPPLLSNPFWNMMTNVRVAPPHPQSSLPQMFTLPNSTTQTNSLSFPTTNPQWPM